MPDALIHPTFQEMDVLFPVFSRLAVVTPGTFKNLASRLGLITKPPGGLTFQTVMGSISAKYYK
jgi:hypothetical protein